MMKGKNKIFALLLTLTLVVGVLPMGNATVVAEGVEPSRAWAATDFVVNGNTITGLTEAGEEQLIAKGGKLEFPDGMTEITIGTSAFKGNKNLKSFSWDRVERIENKAFEDCALEGELIVPDGFAWIGNEAFRNNRITKVRFPDDIKTVGPYAFADNLIEYLHLGELKNITGSRWSEELNIEIKGLLSYGLFKNNKIKEVTIPKNIWGIGVGAFEQNDLKELTIPDTMRNIYYDAFCKNKNLKTVVFEAIPDAHGVKSGIQQIDGGAFEDCGITTVDFQPEYINEMGNYTFSKNKLKELTLPDGRILGSGIFSNNHLEKITFKRYSFNDSKGVHIAASTAAGNKLKNVIFEEYTFNPVESNGRYSVRILLTICLKATC